MSESAAFLVFAVAVCSWLFAQYVSDSRKLTQVVVGVLLVLLVLWLWVSGAVPHHA